MKGSQKSMGLTPREEGNEIDFSEYHNEAKEGDEENVKNLRISIEERQIEDNE
jgi:hypothetical protein